MPFYFNGIQLTLPELNHFLVGESLANGATLYIDVWEDIGPFSAWLYMGLYFVFGKSLWAFHILSFLLMFYQCLLFNSITYRNKLYNDSTYVPALIYGLLMNLSFGMYSLSPILISTTFILLALNNVFKQVEFRMKADEPILNIGIYLGVATLFYLPAGLFGIITLAILVIFSSTIGRRYLLVIYGLILPPLLIVGYYLLINGIGPAWNIFTTKIFNPNKLEYQNLQSLLLLVGIPVLFLFFGFVRVFQRTRFSNYQMRLIKLVVLWLLLSLIILYWAELLIASFILFVPPFAIIITHYFLLVKKKFKVEFIFLFFIVGIVVLNNSILFNWFEIERYIAHDKVLVQVSPYKKYVVDKKIVVFGDDLSIYNDASLGTPFLDWQLSKETLTNPDYYENATKIYSGFVNDPPELIVDLENLMPGLQKRIVFLEENYEKVNVNIYRLKK